jgi:hypothetical protein
MSATIPGGLSISLCSCSGKEYACSLSLSIAKRAANEFPIQKEDGNHTLVKKETKVVGRKMSLLTEALHTYSPSERGIYFTAFILKLFIIGVLVEWFSLSAGLHNA